MNTGQPMYEWNAIPWRKLERNVFKLQQRIYQASSRGERQKVRKLQRLLINSWSAKALAVRRVTQDNRGKKTAGVDGLKLLTPKQRLELVNNLDINRKAKPIRRVWIPKPNQTEKRPLGIPVMHDRAAQALVKMAMEPEWEAKFEDNSYGFRPGRNCHDAIEAIHNMLRHSGKYVLDADISGCFDNINHEELLAKINTSPSITRILKGWLKAGVMEGMTLNKIETGTPQGGVISPLLANIALHGMENLIKGINKNAYIVRYADDFVIFHNNLTVLERCQESIKQWLKQIGLELKPSTTRITHTLQEHKGNIGFNFLGFNVRQYNVSKNNSGKRHKGFKTLIKPSQESIQKHLKAIKDVLDKGKSLPQSAIIKELNPIIRGWTNYYSTQISSEIFKKLTHLTVLMLMRWTRRRHPKKSLRWVKDKYFTRHEGYDWTFAKGKQRLLRHSETSIERWVKVAGNRSPFDGDWVYRSTRMARHPELPKRNAYLLNQQKGRCPHCRMRFTVNDLMEIHHKDGNHRNDKWDNLQLLHRHCHDGVHKTDA